jgi:hypothetical protein
MPRSGWSVTFLAVIVLAASPLAAPASAQASDSARSSVRVRVAGGTDLGFGDTWLHGRSALGAIGLEWMHRRAPFSARLDLSYFRRAQDGGALFCTTEACVYERRYETLGLSLDGRYTFFSQAPVRPYLLSGFGLYVARSTLTTNFACEQFSCSPSPDARATNTERTVGVGLHSGFGIAVPFRRSELSLELRLLKLSTRWGDPYTLPVILGIRF